ncbi:glucose-6-phosphate isomerase [Eggerthella sp. YY7918]|nr:glucose-6-phosphate isomerase [Eggerthella sp. YY7918]
MNVLVSSDRKFRGTSILATATLIFFVISAYYPNYDAPGFGPVETGLGYYEACSTAANLQDRDNLYDREEADFVRHAKDIVDQHYCIYNNADDGSPFAYAFEGLNLCYRRSAAQLLDGGESRQSELLREKIDQLAYNEDVQKALKDANIKYILVLDLGGKITEERCFYGYYTPQKWQGINAIDDNTPGLKVLLSEGDMRLYEIELEEG